MGLKQYFGRAFVAGILMGSTMAGVESAQAVTAKECHAKFKAAKSDGTLNGQTYKAFKAEQCGGATTKASSAKAATAAEEPKKAAPAAEAAPAAAAPAAAPSSTAPSGTAPASSAAPAARPAPAASVAPRAAAVTSGNVVFPSAVSPQYAKLSEGIARRKTCLDQYNANKETGGNGALKWIQKGGGYYSECNNKLK